MYAYVYIYFDIQIMYSAAPIMYVERYLHTNVVGKMY